MPEIQRSRFNTLLKSIFGFRGPLSPSFDSAILPVVILGGDIENDDEVAWWQASANSPAQAGNFSFVQVKIPAGGRAVVDSCWLRQLTAVGIRIGIAQEIAGAGVASALRNPFLGIRGVAWSAASSSLGSVILLAGNQVADPFVLGNSMSVDTTAAGLSQKIDEQFVITPGFAFTVSPGTINTGLTASIFGRWRGDQT